MNTRVASSQLPDFLKLLTHELRWKILTALAHSDYSVQEIVRFLNEPQNVVSYHLRKLRDQHIVTERRSSADERSIYYSLDLKTFRRLYVATGEAVHPALSIPVAPQHPRTARARHSPVRVLFLCTKNSARSQMAEGLLRHLSHGAVEVCSAGSHPSSLHPYALRAMNTSGIDISQQHSKHVDEFRGQSFDYIITVCDRMREVCPPFSGDPAFIHWSFPDPVEQDGSDEERYRAFEQTALQLTTRLRFFLTVIERNQDEQSELLPDAL